MEHKYDLVLYNIETQDKRDDLFREFPHMDVFDGLLVLTLVPEAHEVERILSSGIPVVLVDAQHPDLNRVLIDDVHGGYLATKHLIDLGHTRIAYISDILESPFKFEGASERRFQGYRQAMAEASIAYRSDYYRQDLHGVQEAKGLARELLSLPEPPTAIFAASDTQAIGVLRAAEEMGVSVPENLSVIGFDDIEVAEYLHLTTIHQPLFTSGVEGAELLFQCINKPPMSQCDVREIELPLRLVVRQTTGPSP